ncbi:MAG: hypothetical protein U0793_22460 [Gemmataceae bacterium]
MVITHNAERPALLRNDTQTANHWLRLDLVGDGKKRPSGVVQAFGPLGGDKGYRLREEGASVKTWR